MRSFFGRLFALFAIVMSIAELCWAWETTYTIPTRPVGNWADSEEGARWVEQRRKIGVELLQRKEVGPIRCKLVPIPSDKLGQQLRVELENTSGSDTGIQILRTPLDTVTFVLRAPNGSVVSSFCYLTVHSVFDRKPPVVIPAGESLSCDIYVSTATSHGYAPLPPGSYALEAIFHGQLPGDLPVQDRQMLARSNPIEICVQDK